MQITFCGNSFLKISCIKGDIVQEGRERIKGIREKPVMRQIA
jgi:hypothetical protein